MTFNWQGLKQKFWERTKGDFYFAIRAILALNSTVTQYPRIQTMVES